MRSIIDILLIESEVKEPIVPLPLLGRRGFSIRFKNVSFKYEDKNILKDISFKIE